MSGELADGLLRWLLLQFRYSRWCLPQRSGRALSFGRLPGAVHYWCCVARRTHPTSRYLGLSSYAYALGVLGGGEKALVLRTRPGSKECLWTLRRCTFLRQLQCEHSGRHGVPVPLPMARRDAQFVLHRIKPVRRRALVHPSGWHVGSLRLRTGTRRAYRHYPRDPRASRPLSPLAGSSPLRLREQGHGLEQYQEAVVLCTDRGVQ